MKVIVWFYSNSKLIDQVIGDEDNVRDEDSESSEESSEEESDESSEESSEEESDERDDDEQVEQVKYLKFIFLLHEDLLTTRCISNGKDLNLFVLILDKVCM
jgi:hypothetical protein